MANAASYFDLVREMKDAYNHRQRLVENAKRIPEHEPARGLDFAISQKRRDRHFIRVIVRERCTEPANASLKLFAFRTDFIGSCCTAGVGV